MDYTIPELLLQLPTIAIDEQYVQNNSLTLSVTDAAAAAEAYCKQINEYLQNREEEIKVEKDILPAIEFALRLFNAENFSGELVPTEREQLAPVLDRYTMKDELHERYMQRLLMSDGEMPHPCLRLGGLLLTLLAIVNSTRKDTRSDNNTNNNNTNDNNDNNNKENTVSWLVPYDCIWRLRVHMRHQRVLQHRAHTIYQHLFHCVDATLALPETELTVEQLLEVGQVHHYYHRRDLAAELFWRAARKSGLSVQEDAILGVRTRWQQHQIVQMILNARSATPFTTTTTTNNNNSSDDNNNSNISVLDTPRICMGEMDGHDLLDRPRPTADAPALTLEPLHPLDKAILLALCDDIRNTNPHHGLTQHHMQTYIERLLADPAPAPFMIQCQALLLRCRLERQRNRVQERAFMQLTELVDQHAAGRDPTRSTFHRTAGSYLYIVAYPTIWELRSEFAGVCYDTNLYKTALDAYERVQDWPRIIDCCKVLDKRRRAESLARELLISDPCNPLLWVALGEATRDADALWRAFELSNHSSAAPLRALARLALEREAYADVVNHFDAALKINPVFGGDWFTLGYAAMRLQMWQRSGEAFTRVCQMQPGDAFAWNNLASVLLRSGALRPAFNAMSQALHNNRRDWRMWQNYFAIGCELKEVTETTHALNVMLDIAKRNTRLERASLNRFVDNAIAYMEGKIPASHAGIEEEETEEEKKEAQEAAAAANAMIPTHTSVALTETMDAEELEMMEKMDRMMPFGSDVEMPESFFAHKKDVNSEESRRVQVGIVERYKQRMRETFHHITDLFVTDPEIYACGAKLHRYMDGAFAGYEMRLKELRCCQQKDQWERDATRFARTCECLQSMVEDALAALHDVTTVNHTDSTNTTNDNNTNNNNNNNNNNTGSAEGASQDVSETQKPDMQKRIIVALNDTLNNITAVVDAAEEHMSESEDYKQLKKVLLPRVREGLRSAKLAFNSD